MLRLSQKEIQFLQQIKKKRANKSRVQTTAQLLTDSLGLNRYQLAEYGQHRLCAIRPKSSMQQGER